MLKERGWLTLRRFLVSRSNLIISCLFNEHGTDERVVKVDIQKELNIHELAKKVLDYDYNEEEGIWWTENGYTNWFNPFDVNDDCEKVKNELRQNNWLIQLQDKVDYEGGFISSGKIINTQNGEEHYTETINERYTVCSLALKTI